MHDQEVLAEVQARRGSQAQAGKFTKFTSTWVRTRMYWNVLGEPWVAHGMSTQSAAALLLLDVRGGPASWPVKEMVSRMCIRCYARCCVRCLW
jgi:hypothetical protein